MIWRALLLVGAVNLTSAAAAQPADNPGRGPAAPSDRDKPSSGEDCIVQSLTIDAGNQISLNYSPTEPRATEVSFDVEVQGTGCSRAVVPFALEATNELRANNGALVLRSGSDELEASIRKRSGGNSNGAVLVQLDDNGTEANNQLVVFLEPGQAVTAGTYTAAVTMKPLSQSAERRSGVAAQTFTIAVTVAPTIGLAAASGMLIDLGNIVVGRAAPESVRFRAYANIDYTLNFKTDHGLRLRRSYAEAEPNIPYVLLFNNGRLTQNGSRQSFSNPGTVGYREHSLNAEVPAMTLKPAGTYSDFVTVEITAVVAGSS